MPFKYLQIHIVLKSQPQTTVSGQALPLASPCQKAHLVSTVSFPFVQSLSPENFFVIVLISLRSLCSAPTLEGLLMVINSTWLLFFS